MKVNLKKISLALFCIYLVAVAALCFLRPSSLPEMNIKTFLGLPIDKVLHFLMFLPYPVLSGMSFMRREYLLLRNIFILLVLAVVGIGMAYGTEVIQAQTGYRAYEMADFYADMTGIATGSVAVLAYLIHIRLKK